MPAPAVRNLLFTCSVLTLLTAMAPKAMANPQDGVVTAGSATIVTNGNKLDIHQSTDKAVIDWRNFDIDAGEETEFHQLNSKSIALNRVNSNKPSSINGKLTANGNVVIVNQNGVMFGAGSQVDVNGLVVSTADITNENFMNGNLKFDKAGNPNAKIVNAGTITAKDAGLVGFVAPHVENSGVIVANLGRVHLASGDKATVDLYGDGLMEVEASDDITAQIVRNTGTIEANGGKIALTAAAGKNIVNSLIQADGVLKAKSVGVQNGEIVIGNTKPTHSDVIISGTLDTSGKQIGEKGGSITVTGKNITLASTARLDASGKTGGGNIKLGGDYQGKGATPTAKTLTVNSGAIITNDAIETGNGGRTILWSDGDTIFRGLITARGGGISGDGGFAEVSGKGTLLYDGLANLSAINGKFGTLLLDPTDITISNAASSNTTGTTSITGTAATSNINVSTLQTQLNSAAVTINTASAYGGNGDITVVDAVSWSANTLLTLTATRDILINAALSATVGNAGVTATAGRDIIFNASIGNTGSAFQNINVTATRDLTIASGATVKAVGTLSLRAANGVVTNTGLLTLNGAISVGSTGTLTLLSGLDSSSNRGDLTLTNTNFLMQGATISAPSITGFRDVTLNRSITSSGAFALTAFRNLTLGSGSTITTGISGALTLNAANGAVGGLGLLTLHGALNVGTGTVTLLSGVDGSGNRSDLTLDSTNFLMQSPTLASPQITGFRDITLNRDFISSGTISLTAYRNLTVGSGVTVRTGSSSSLSLNAANASTSGIGLLTMNGILSVGSNNLTLTSGVDGSGNRSDLTLNNANFLKQTATSATTNVSGFNDISLNTSIAFSGGATFDAYRNITIGTGATITAGSTNPLILRAANASASGTGTFTLNGTLSVGTGSLTIISGLDGSGNLADLTLDNSNFLMQGAAISQPTLTGFRDINLNRNLTFSNTTTITANRNLTIGTGATITSSSNGALTLRAAGGTVANPGVFTLNGAISMGTSVLSLVSGVDTSGNRTDLTLNNSNFLMQGAVTSGPTLTGFRDITISRDLITSNTIAITANRNLTIGHGVTITPVSAFALSLRAAGGSSSGTGVLTMNGTLNVGTAALTLVSGSDDLGNRTDLTLDNTNFLMQGATVAGFTIGGFKDITFNRNLTSSAGISVTAARNLTVSNGVTLQTGSVGGISLLAAGGATTSEGILSMNGILNLGVGALTLTSGVDALGNGTDLTLDSTNFLMQGASFNGAVITGFRDVLINTAMTSGTYNIAITANRNLTVGSSVTFETGNGFSVSLKAAGNNINGIGLLTYNGKINLNNNSVLSLLSGVDASGNRADLTIDNTNYIMLGATTGPVNFLGFRDININTSLLSSQGINIVAQRNLNVANGVTIQSGPTHAISLQAAGGNANGEGLLNLNSGVINIGTGLLTLVSGLDGSGNRTDLVLDNSNYLMQGATSLTPVLTGFRDITLNRNLSSSAGVSITANRDLIIGAGVSVNSGGTSGISLKAARNLTIGTGATLTSTMTGGISLLAADGTTTGTGTLQINGTLNIGANILTLGSGLDSFGNRVDLTLDNTNLIMQGPTIGSVSINGFRDTTLNRDITSSGDITISSNRNLTLGSGYTLTTGLTRGITLKAAGDSIDNIGLLTIGGTIRSGTSSFILLSGKDTSGNRNDLNLDSNNLYWLGSENGALRITGFRDVTFAHDIVGTSYVDIQAMRNLTVQSVKSGLTNSLTLIAAGGDINNTGILTFTGKLTPGSQNNPLSFISGLDSFGNRTDLILNAANFEAPNNLFGVNFSGFRDIHFDTDILISSVSVAASNSIINAARDIYFNNNLTRVYTNADRKLLVTAGRDIIMGAGSAIAGGNGTTLVAGRNFINNSGSNAISVDSGNWQIYSTSPDDTVTGGLAYNFRSFGCSYGQTCSLGSGNGFIYSQNQTDFIKSGFTLPQTVEYASQTPLEPSKNIFMRDAKFSKTRMTEVDLTIDRELAQQMNLDERPYQEN